MTSGRRDEIEIYHDRVVVFGQVMTRPPRMAPSQWMLYWENLKKEER